MVHLREADRAMMFYHIYADNKTVRKISMEEYTKLERGKRSLIAMVVPDYIILVKNLRAISTTQNQLKQIIEEKEF